MKAPISIPIMKEFTIIILLFCIALALCITSSGTREYKGGRAKRKPSDMALIQIPPFPYKRLSMTKGDVIACFANLAKYDLAAVKSHMRHSHCAINGNIDPKLLEYHGDNAVAASHLSILLPDDEYAKYNNISDYFNEEARMQCRKSYAVSPIDYWKKNHRLVIAEAKKRYGKDDPFTLRETQYELFKKECETFKPSIAVALVRLFGAKSMLDISAGWGDRLAAALATNTRYVAADPNTALHPGYRAMCEFHKQNCCADVTGVSPATLICDGFIEAMAKHDPRDKFDLVLSSPPYFDLEIYNKSDKQSIVQFPVLDAWFNGFLIPALTIAHDRLNEGGHLVINIEDDFKNKYVERMIRTFRFDKFMGTIVFTKSLGAKGRPFFVWRK